MNWLAIFIGGGLGSLLRFGLSRILLTLDMAQLPWATFASNTISTAILGLTVLKFTNHQSLPFYFLVIGFCGGFSTFSTFSNETFMLAKNGQFIWAIANVLVSVVFCLSILFLISKAAK